jgi:membrane protein DedA with SNARE-associated domain
MTKTARGYLIEDFAIIILSIFAAVILIKTQVLTEFLTDAQEYTLLGSFFAGMFFTSIFTTAPSVVALAEISQIQPILVVSFVGALGALVGDLIIFRFIKDRLSEHLMELMKHQIEGTRLMFKHHLKFFRWITFFVGAVIIASPLPDEVGIGLLGLSKMSMKWFVPIAFIANFIGILLVALVANSLVN